MNGCSCNAEEAREYIQSEVENLRELRDADDLRHDDFEVACSNLGLDNDYVIYFITALAA